MPPHTATARPRLVDRVPLGRHAADDEMLESFIDWVTELGLEMYPAQEEALLEIMAGKHVILNTPTGSGKSLVAIAAEFRAMCTGKRCYYTSPIKALVSEKFFDLCEVFGAENVGMQTGDASINPDAPVVCCTAEVLANLALREGASAAVDAVVMDEFHYYADRERGIAWQIPLLTLPQATFLLMSATLGDMRHFEQDLRARTGREVAIVASAQRPVPLEFDYRETPITETIEELIERERAPIYVVNFTQRDAAEQAQALTSMRLLSKERRAQVTDFIGGFRFDSAYGRDIQRFLKAGVGLHHAGLLPKYRRLVEKLAQQGMLAVVCGTDTLGVGVNVPIRTVLFSKLCKYDGEKTAILSVRDFKQIGGRAGRKGFDDRGWVVCQAPEHVIENKRLEAKAAGAGKKKFVRRKPPERGYVPWDAGTFERLTHGEPEELRSSFRITHQIMLNLLQRSPAAGTAAGRRGGGYRALIELIDESHESEARSSHLRRDAAQLFRALRRAEIVELEPSPSGGQLVKINEDLQREFSLFQTLALYLVDALALLDEGAEDYALDVVTLVESVLENPRQILLRQQDIARGEAIERMKADGMEYAQRMEELDRVTYPKPNADFIYRSFDAFCLHHPWVGHENIRPKSIVRDMVERYATFNDYVRDYGIQRVEGILLRYLNEAYKTLVQTVPDAFKSDAVVDIIAYLRALLARVDDSLVREWERMVAGGGALVAADEAGAPEVELDVSRDRRVFVARVRAELHRLVQALAARDWEEASACVRVDESADWSPEAFEAALAPFFEEHDAIVFDARARMVDNTHVSEREDHLWEVRQVVRDTDDDNLWMIVGEVDLRQDRAPAGPLVSVVRIGT